MPSGLRSIYFTLIKPSGVWSVYDNDVGKTVAFNNSLFDLFTTNNARIIAKKSSHPGSKNSERHPTLVSSATETRSVKCLQKGPGCEDINQLFL